MGEMKKQWVLPLVVVVLSLLLFQIRDSSHAFYEQNRTQSWATEYSATADRVLAGAVPGIFSDFLMLDVFSIYYEAQQAKKPSEMKYVNTYLSRAQSLDPKFFDVYRLASSILAYDANMPNEAVALLKKGMVQRPYVWEFPFFAGFLAHDLLKDDKLAYELMSSVADRENTPVMVLTLASRFLESSSTKEDAILFLKGLLQLVPEGNREGIKKRIEALKHEEN